MTGDPDFDLEAILGPDADPERRARLATMLSDALADEHDVQTSDVAKLAAYLDQGLTESERQSFQRDLCKSAIARADVESAADLLETVQNSTQRPSRAVMRHAGNVMMAAAAQLEPEREHRMVAAASPRSKPESSRVAAASPRPQPTFWQRLSTPRAKIGLGLAFASLAAVLVWNAETGMNVSQVATKGTSQGHEVSQEAIVGASPDHAATSTAQSPQIWGAIALSSDGSTYGISHGETSQELARAIATTDCIARHGVNCRVVIAGQGQCFALAGQAGGVPTAAVAENYNDAKSRAMAACNATPKGVVPCTVTEAFCSGP
jgi:hypothetical protein